MKIYDLTDKIPPSVKYSTYLPNEMVETDLLFTYNDKKITQLTPYLDNLKNARYTIIDAYMSDQYVRSEMLGIRKKWIAKINNIDEKKEEIKEDIPKQINEIYKTFLTLEMKKINIEILNKKKYFIYKLTNNEEEFIFGSFIKMKKTDYKKIHDKYDIIFTNIGSKVSLEEIQEIEIYLDCEGHMKVDEIIFSQNIKKKCLNINYNIIRNYSEDIIISTKIEKIKNDVYLLVQKDYMKTLKICENYDYDKISGYVAYIQNEKNEIYVFSGYKTSVMTVLENMYMENKCDILINNDISKLKFKILEKYIDQCDLKMREQFYKNQLEIIKIEVIQDKNDKKNIKDKEKKIIKDNKNNDDEKKQKWNGFKYCAKK
jgi:hypothetical protein